jgi:uncharacterized protein (DUF1684 family)
VQLPLVLTLLALLGATLAGGCTSEPVRPDVDRAALRSSWEGWVAARDSLFRSPDSPLLDADRAAFDGLPYFAYDSSLTVPAALVPAMRQDTISFPTTSGALQQHVSAGHLVFEVGGVQRRLEAFESVGGPEPRLFVPFRDATSGRTTYGGGRYLDLEHQPSGRYALDLNRAYHPYCVYNSSYSCPLPPAENRLEVAVTAGERLPGG